MGSTRLEARGLGGFPAEIKGRCLRVSGLRPFLGWGTAPGVLPVPYEKNGFCVPQRSLKINIGERPLNMKRAPCSQPRRLPALISGTAEEQKDRFFV